MKVNILGVLLIFWKNEKAIQRGEEGQRGDYFNFRENIFPVIARKVFFPQKMGNLIFIFQLAIKEPIKQKTHKSSSNENSLL